MTTVAFTTLGCKVNQYDTDVMKTSFLQRGYSIVGSDEKADVYIVNTCAVTGMAARKSRQMTARARKQNPTAIVVVTGCLGQLESNDVKEMTDADIVTGNVEKSKLVDLIEEFSGSRLIAAEDIFEQTGYLQETMSTQDDRSRIFIKVQDGCNNYCSYCAIPFARGRSRSRDKADILKEIQSYADNDTAEVVITGIHLDSYGMDLVDCSLIDLLEGIDGVSNLSRVRLGSLEPLSITDDFMKRAAVLRKLCPHFHLSLQSGCDETLKRMRRRYTVDEYYQAVRLIREYFRDAAVTTDIIVGFPGESEEEFNSTLDFVRKIGFMKIHVFRFSARKGTLAYAMPGKITGEVKKQRSDIMSKVSDDGFHTFVKTMMDRPHSVIAEKLSESNPGYWEGHTENYIKTLFKCPDCSPGKEYHVDFLKIDNDFVFSSLHTGTGV
ncbi:MAG: tRNA (N(6)-L-threonylcarbamoyladenosine(37)-C(2))-methylthiotransferase MtaB [Clostridia bacterium]|nr:tRNA (N(6)-L-threonylcarbamoyladenosine(37)-C(2))-methylthiotransferase MtaB [Clostridia bacterium]MBN2883792.1 tRNA (N(6)-L-threonylcarbamoyladenosine(37)-C(2))-methylthiotransferase MtaB [Clostridia bacterium]